MESDPLFPGHVDETAARLARLSARRATPARPTSPPPANPVAAPPLLASGGRPPIPPPPPPAPAVAKRRRHPARHSRTAALALSFATTGGLAFWFATTDGASASNTGAEPAGVVGSAALPTATVPATTAATNTTVTTNTTAAATPAATAPATSAPATTAAPSTATAVVNGQSFSNRYGNVQVQATFGADGSLVDVSILQYPNDARKSVSINNYAVPKLNAEALQAQSANVDTVSGATYTTHGYEESLQSAIDVARANGITTLT